MGEQAAMIAKMQCLARAVESTYLALVGQRVLDDLREVLLVVRDQVVAHLKHGGDRYIEAIEG